MPLGRQVLGQCCGGWPRIQARAHDGNDEIVHVRHHQDFLQRGIQNNKSVAFNTAGTLPGGDLAELRAGAVNWRSPPEQQPQEGPGSGYQGGDKQEYFFFALSTSMAARVVTAQGRDQYFEAIQMGGF